MAWPLWIYYKGEKVKKYEAPEIGYEKLKAGDVVFTGGRGLFSRVIRRITGKGKKAEETATHVGIIVDFNGQKLVAEMLGGGLTISSLEEYRKSPRRFIIGVGTLPGMTDESRKKLGELVAIHRRKTIEYDWPGIFTYIGIGRHDPDRFYCSEYVAKLLADFGIVKVQPGPFGGVSPEDLLAFFKMNHRARMIEYTA